MCVLFEFVGFSFASMKSCFSHYYRFVVTLCVRTYASCLCFFLFSFVAFYVCRVLFASPFFVVPFEYGALFSFSVLVCFPIDCLPRIISYCYLFVCGFLC